MTRLSPERFAAAAAVYDPSLLMRVQAQPAKPRRPRATLRGETVGAVLLAATKASRRCSSSSWGWKRSVNATSASCATAAG
jgi:hypothetical protein